MQATLSIVPAPEDSQLSQQGGGYELCANWLGTHPKVVMACLSNAANAMHVDPSLTGELLHFSHFNAATLSEEIVYKLANAN